MYHYSSEIFSRIIDIIFSMMLDLEVHSLNLLIDTLDTLYQLFILFS